MAVCNTWWYQSLLHIPSPPVHLLTRFKSFTDPHSKVLSITHLCSLPKRLVHRYKIPHNAGLNCLYCALAVCPPMSKRIECGAEWLNREIQLHQMSSKHIFCSHPHCLGTELRLWSPHAAADHVLHDCLLWHINVVLDGVHPTLEVRCKPGWPKNS